MSRRKQSHPKPIKDSGKDEIDQVCRSHNLPSHILHLQELTDDPELEYSVHSISTILQGSQFGPFSCTVLDPADEEHNNESCCIIEFPLHSADSELKLFLLIESPSGQWLRLLRKTNDVDMSNIKLYIKEEHTLWCEVTKNIPPDVELVATLVHDDKTSSNLSSLSSTSSSVCDDASRRISPLVVVAPNDRVSNSESFASPLPPPPPLSVAAVQWDSHPSLLKRKERKTASSGFYGLPDPDADHHRPTFSLIHVCMFCGVRFSSPRTLEAHIANYCSKKPMDQRLILPNQLALPYTSTVSNTSNKFSPKKSIWHDGSDASDNSRKPIVDADRNKSQKRSLEEDDDETVNSASKIVCKVEPAEVAGNIGKKDVEKPTKTTTRSRQVSETDDPTDAVFNDDDGDVTYACPHCSYSFDSPINLKQHLRVHYLAAQHDGVGGGGGYESDKQTTGSGGSEYVCSNCNIKFSSFNTYKGHREFYCQKRSRTGSKSRNDASPAAPNAVDDDDDGGTALPLAPFCSLPHARMPFFSPGSTVFPSPLFPPPCLPFASQAQAVFLAAAPFLGGASLPSMTFNLPIVVQHLAPLLSNGMFQSNRQLGDDLGNVVPIVKRSSSSLSAAAVPALKKAKTGSDSNDEKPLDLSTRKGESSAPRDRAASAKSPQLRRVSSATSIDGDRRRRSNSPAASFRSVAHGIGIVREGGSSSAAAPPSSSSSALSVVSSPFTIGNMLPVKNATSPCADDRSPSPSPLMVAPPLLPPPSISKCLDCNIVFYKHENYVAHKEHYCAGRFAKHLLHGSGFGSGSHGFVRRSSLVEHPCTAADESRAVLPPTNPTVKQTLEHLESAMNSPRSSSNSRSPELVATLDQGTLQYYCIPCKIKFSSLDTLKAHKKFYCPVKLSSPTELASPEDGFKADERFGGSSSSSSSSNRGGCKEANDCVVLACSACGNTFASAQLLKLHYCTGNTVRYPLFHCPYCDYIAQSDSRLVDHIKAHAPSRAYKCVLCGYRGNTVRGMRMHGKMHNDAGETFTDESMIEYEEPPMIPKRLRSTAAGDATTATLGDMEVELIRLKNEPYKRRRSRKAYEKSEFCQGPAPIRCVQCAAMLPDADRLQLHMQGHVAETILVWKSSYGSNSAAAPDVGFPRQQHAERQRRSSQNVADEDSSERTLSNETTAKEPDVCSDRVNSDPVPEGGEEDVTERSAVVVVVKEELIDVTETENLSAESLPDSAKPNEKSHADASEPTNNNDRVAEPDDEDVHILRQAKEKISRFVIESNPDDDPRDEKRQRNENAFETALENCDVGNDVVAESPENDVKIETDRESGVDDGNVAKYCKQCNITFMYTSTFIAHKKYYCSSHAAERNVGPPISEVVI